MHFYQNIHFFTYYVTICTKYTLQRTNIPFTINYNFLFLLESSDILKCLIEIVYSILFFPSCQVGTQLIPEMDEFNSMIYLPLDEFFEMNLLREKTVRWPGWV